ncbi:SusD/RagB family nutrient-binding outer membrane lipoprotein [Elizabethkingia argentiflava]|uniref:SusD/RagB family nutrient-binding outer membrane lipoprotein n=1 Tax=Elizabethkingia argenteiflava TaxID=2681556 RepID=A0A845Q000_9FLAO|nr:SusD/RagB family nutrient-binding outer membrane lipoprotein [Elizabethkingia argenteiflava]NAW51938.1 SusD/RagB family nutrient-binding outer membrane lipoprotein [Elizabethkingia argenteiflava]
MNLPKIFIVAITFLLPFTSCNNYLDINENPNKVLEGNLQPNNIFPGAVSETFRVHARDLVNLGALYTNYIGTNSAVYGNGNDPEFMLTLNTSFYSALWDGTLRGVNNLQIIIDKAHENPIYIYYSGMAKIMKVFYMQTIVDLYGDIPYTEAFGEKSRLTPAYEKDSDIYGKMFKELDEALVELDDPNKNKDRAIPGNEDIVFRGDRLKWKAFANNIKLRMIIRMSNAKGELAKVRNQQLISLRGAAFLNEDVVVNPGYSAANDDSQNPFTNYFFASSGRTLSQAFRMDTASGHLAICLNSNDKNDATPFYQKFNGIQDGRKSRMFSVDKNNRVIGVKQGVRPGDPDMAVERPISSFGPGWFTKGERNLESASSRGGALMTKSEIDFLKAEASLKYPDLGIQGKTAFESGIKASFNYLDAQGATDYIAKINTVKRLGWLGSNDEKLDAIMTQKWLALGLVAPIQVFFDYNRTGYPYIPLSKRAVQNNKPYRLMYPNSELAANSQNVPKLSASECFSKNAFTPFWLK